MKKKKSKRGSTDVDPKILKKIKVPAEIPLEDVEEETADPDVEEEFGERFDDDKN